MRNTVIFLNLLLALTTALVWAQDHVTLPEPHRAEVAAEDGLTLVGDFYAVPDTAGDVTSVAISPSDYPLLNEEMFETMSERSVLFIVGRYDVFFTTRVLFDRTSGEVALYAYNSAAHGTVFLRLALTETG
jgi:hypothetical protein